MDALHAAEHLGSIHLAIRHKHIIAVPERTACSRLEQAVFHAETIAFPEHILSVESTVAGFYVARLFDSRFARVNAHILQAGIMKRIKRPFAPVFLILDECLVLLLNLYTLLYIEARQSPTGFQPADLKSSFSQTRAFSPDIQTARRFRHPDAPNCLPTKTSNQESQISNRPKAKLRILNSQFKSATKPNSKFLIQNSKLPKGSIQNSQFLIQNC